MNSGLLASRYASALERYSCEQGQSGECYADARQLLALIPSIEEYLRKPLPAETKTEILSRALPGRCDSFGRFLLLVVSHRREMYLRRILQSYIAEYKKDRGIADARLTVASEPSEELLEKLRKLTLASCGATSVDIEVTVDPDIIGGFVYTVADKRLDASVRRQLSELRKAFETNNKRII